MTRPPVFSGWRSSTGSRCRHRARATPFGLPAGSSNNVEVGVRLHADTAVPDGAEIANTGYGDGRQRTDGERHGRRRRRCPSGGTCLVAIQDLERWQRRGRNGRGEQHHARRSQRVVVDIAQMSSLTVEDANADTFDRFTVTAGSARSPSHRVPTGSPCSPAPRSCRPARPATTRPVPAQTGPALALPGGVDAEDVTGLRFVFSNAAGTRDPRLVPTPAPSSSLHRAAGHPAQLG